MPRKYLLRALNIETEIEVIGTPREDILADSLPPGGTTGQALKKQSNADQDAVWEDAGSSVLTGHLVWVDAVNGDDATGLVGDASKPFLTHDAAMAAASSGDCVVTRPGTYVFAAPVALKDGVDQWFMLDTYITPAAGDIIFKDNGTAVACRIGGHASFLNDGASAFLRCSGGSDITVRCHKISQADGIAIQVLNNSPVISVIADEVNAPGAGVLVQIQGGSPSVSIDAARSITAGQLLVQSGGSAINVAIKSPKITSDGTTNGDIDLANGGVTLDMETDLWVSLGSDAIKLESASNVVNVRANRISTTGNLLRNAEASNTVSIDVLGDLNCSNIVLYGTTAGATLTMNLTVGGKITAPRLIYSDAPNDTMKVTVDAGVITTTDYIADVGSGNAITITVVAKSIHAAGLFQAQSGGSGYCYFDVDGDIVVTGGGYNAVNVLSGNFTVSVRGYQWAVSGGSCFRVAGGANVHFFSDIIDTISGTQIVKADDGAGEAHVSARSMYGGDDIVTIGGAGVFVMSFEAAALITAGRILADSGSAGATRVSIKGTKITGTAAANHIDIANAGTGRYDIDADILIATARVDLANGECHINAPSHVGAAPGGGGALYGISGAIFARYDECRAKVGTLGCPVNIGAATIHLLSGRVIGENAAGGAAITVYDSGALLRLYPGVALIAGAAAAASIAVDTGITPTVVAMGAIAANKAADVAVTIAVGSLLVDAAVA